MPSRLSNFQQTAQQRVLIIDYGMGNLHSAGKAITHVAPEAEVIISDNPQLLETADRVILPGVGAMRDCMAALTQGGWVEPLKAIWHKKPLLGICVGMQMLLESSEENGGSPGLGYFKGHAVHIGQAMEQSKVRATHESFKVPHMGWNQVKQVKDHPCWAGIPDQSRFYFVHSYAFHAVESDCSNDLACLVGSVEYGSSWGAALAKDNVFAVQFHPEKSQHVGLKLLKNFIAWQP